MRQDWAERANFITPLITEAWITQLKLYRKCQETWSKLPRTRAVPFEMPTLLETLRMMEREGKLEGHPREKSSSWRLAVKPVVSE